MTQPSPMRPLSSLRNHAKRADVPAAPPRRQLHIDIQRLTLPGYTPDQQRRFTQTLHAELNRLASRLSAWNGTAHARMAQLDAGQLPIGAAPEDAAKQLASRLFDRLRLAKGGNARV